MRGFPINTNDRRRGRQHRHRGSIYVVALGTGMVVTLVGLAAAVTIRIEGRGAVGERNLAEAEALAFSAVEHALAVIDKETNGDEPAWREEFIHGETAVTVEIGNGNMRWMLLDDQDGDLADDNLDPVRIYGIGQVGGAVHVSSLLLQPDGEALEALRTALHAAGQVWIKSGASLTASGAPVSTNANLQHDGVVFGDVEAFSHSGGGTITGSVTVPAPPKNPPDPGVFDLYRSMATMLDYSGSIDKDVLAPGNNTYGGGLSTDGLYYIETGGNDLIIRDSRIFGTLVVDTGGGAVVLDTAVFLHNAQSRYPVLIVQGNVEFRYLSGSLALSEASAGTNFNPVGAPYEAESDNDLSDTYPNEIQGLVHVKGTVEFFQTARVHGVVICESTAKVEEMNEITHDPRLASNPPMGYTSGNTMTPVQGSWRWDSPPPP